MSIHNFLHRCVTGSVKDLEYMCFGLLRFVCGLISVSLWFPLWSLIYDFVQVLFLNFVINF